MKDKRNCGTPYPIYPQNVIPTMPVPYMTGYNQNYTVSNTIDQQINGLEQKVAHLETRLSKLENLLNNTNNQYNGSNYYMV